MDSPFIFEEAWRTLVGDQIGTGMFRTVYACLLDPSLVIKTEDREGSFHNILEWENWDDNQFAPAVARWLAPCVAISPCGGVLVQKRVDPIRPGEPKLPKQIPSFLTDVKLENFGWFENRIVCCDYGYTHTTLSTRLRKARWAD